MLTHFFSNRFLFLLFVLGTVNANGQPDHYAEIQQIAQTDLKGAICYADSLIGAGVEPQDKVLHLLGVMHLDLHKPGVALFYFEREQELHKASGDKEKMAQVLIRMGEVNVYLSKKEKALSLLLDGLAIVQKIKNKKLEARIYHTLGLIYTKLQDKRKGIEYLRKAKVIQEILFDTLGFSETYNDLGVAYSEIGLQDSGVYYLKKSLDINESRGNFLPVSVNHANLIGVYQKIGNDKEVIRSYEKTIEMQTKLGILDPRTCLGFAVYLINTGRKSKAKKYRKMALELVNEHARPAALEIIFKELFGLALQEKNYQEAIYYQNKSDSIVDLKRALAIEEKLALVNRQFQLERKEAILERKLAINRRNKLLFGSLSLLLLFFGLFLIQQNRNTKLKNQKERVILEQKVLSSQMNPHFVYNTLSAIQSSLLKNDPLTSADNLAVFAKLIRQNFELVAKERVSLEEDLDALINYIKTQQFRFDNQFEYEITIDKDIDTQMIEVPPLLLQPFVENAIEHGLKELKEPGVLKISIFKSGDGVCFRVTDNGVGLEKMQQNEHELHALDIFKQRISLIHKDDMNSFSLSDESGETVAKYCLTL